MRIICPHCSQQHEVPEDRLRSDLEKATMQCARCKTIFPLAAQGRAPKRRLRVSHNRLLAGVLIAIGVALVLMLLAFVALKNKGVLELDNLPEQVKIALADEPLKTRDQASPPLDITLNNGYRLIIKDKKPILVVKGKIENTGSVKRTRIILEGRIVDNTGQVQFTTRAPCGKMFANKRLRKTKRGAFSKLFVRKKEYINCVLEPGQKKWFQLIFDDIPEDYDDDYTVQVKTLFSGHESEV
jgi:hypothetical protein